jgi:ubiquinone/menaquinone biosynthesis C-methylase UbiE
MDKIREYYEREASELEDHQENMYFENPWSIYWHANRLREVLRIANHISYANLLDVGCAEGYYLRLLTGPRVHEDDDGYYGVGFDVARNYLLKARKKAPSALLCQGDIHRLPFKNDSFDLVLCSEVLEHVLNPELAFKELVRVSKKYLLLTVAGENLLHYLAKKLSLIEPEDPYAEIGHGHIHEAKMSETIFPWASEASCKPIERVVTCYFPLSSLQKHRMPASSISVIRFLDKILSKMPVIKEFGAVQIALLRKRGTHDSNSSLERRFIRK